MLVLRRKVSQKVLVRVPGRAEPIVIKVLEVGRGWARLGFAAGADIEIQREELDK